ncbi:hypothetical protein GTA08_BOTSDO00550 [Botryosphaeria dothidea]|uniref:Rhodopsin domain-containing protein n=1 Tax=Botryosphaeria dothidea TaxID=55169 RepID=A0A8H4N9G1_9PEZI|nr:hypothetical protein GTA08_BOTSDO00550 [Botryosphaeria dothidea]
MGRTLKPPLDLVLAWQTDAYPHGVRRDHTLLILATVFSAIAFIFVLVRLTARLGIQRNPGLDDLFIVPALISTIGMNVCIAYTSRHGFDRHVWDLTPQMAVDLRKFTFSISFLYIWGTGLTKISVLFFYRRLTGSLPMPFLYAVYASLFYVSAYLVTFTISLGLTCNPVYAYWKQVDFIWAAANATKFKCIDEGATLIATNAISITQDFLACTMPALLLWNLQVSKRQKIAMSALLGVSIFPCVAVILRFIYLYRAAYTTYDIPWEMFPSWIWTLIEANVGLLCASVPALRVFFKRTLQISFQRSRSEEKDSGPM